MRGCRPRWCIAGGKPCGIPGIADEEDRKIFPSKLMPESEDVGLQPGLGSAADDQDLEQEAGEGVAEGEEHGRRIIAWRPEATRRPGQA